jgi:hypothetical protein
MAGHYSSDPQHIVFKKSIIPYPVIMIFSQNQYIVVAPTLTKIEFIRINSISRLPTAPNHHTQPRPEPFTPPHSQRGG